MQVKQTAILIIGMHRSGTSLLASIVNALGIDIGNELHPADAHNPAGYFEDRVCMEIQERMLLALGQPWHDEKGMLPYPPLWWRRPEIAPLIQELEAWLDARIGKGEPRWVLKDPRTTRFVPLWNELLAARGVEVRYLLAVRDPSEVALSEAARDGVPTERIYRTWLTYNADGLLHAGSQLAGVFIYKRWFDDGIGQMRRLAAILDIDRNDDYLRTILDQRLCTALYRQDGSGAGSPPWACHLYARLQALAHRLCHADRSRLGTEAEYFASMLRNKKTPAVRGSLEAVITAGFDFEAAAQMVSKLEDPGVRLVLAVVGETKSAQDCTIPDAGAIRCEPTGVQIEASDPTRNTFLAWQWLRSRMYDKVHFLGGAGLATHYLDASRQGLDGFNAEVHLHYLRPPSWLDEGGRVYPASLLDLEASFLDRRALNDPRSNIAASGALAAMLGQLAARDRVRSQVYHPAPSMMPLVSVCITHHNRAAFVKDCVASVRAQTYSPLEVILIDDGSTDPAALAVLDELEEDFATRGWKIIRSENRYLGAARNAAAQQASGEYLFFLDDDNLLMSEGLARAVGVARHTGADVVTAVMSIFSGPPGTSPRRPEALRVFPGSCALLGMFANFFGDAAALVRRSTWSALGGFTEDRGVGAEDWEFFAKAVLHGYRLEHCLEPLSWYRLNPSGMIFTGDSLKDYRRALRAYEPMMSPALRDLPALAGMISWGVAQFERCRAEVQELQTTRHALMQHVSELEAWKSAAAEEMAEIYARLSDRDSQLSALSADLEQHRALAAMLAAEVRRLAGERDAVYQSTSWRITAPLRAVRNVSRRVRRPR